MILGLKFVCAIILAAFTERGISSRDPSLSGLTKAVFWALTCVIVVFCFKVPDAPMFQVPALARIFFFHFPCPIVTTWFVFSGAYLGMKYLKTRDRQWDIKAAAANELGLIFGLIGMAIGIIFSKIQWGAWWQWDPRQTSFMLVLLIYMAYFVLRAGYADENKRAAYASAYSATAFIPNVFLIFVFPRLPQIAAASFHPSATVSGGLLDKDYGNAAVGTMYALFTLGFWLYRLRTRTGELELKLEEMNARLASGSDHAPTGVVRPVSVPDQS